MSTGNLYNRNPPPGCRRREVFKMNKNERLSKPSGQERWGSRSEFLLALLVVGFDFTVAPVLEAIEKGIDKLRGRIESEITVGTLPDD